MNDTEREQWVINDEPLYGWWRRSRQAMRPFIREHRQEIDIYIEEKMNAGAFR